ncbi:MAG: hypothetical protein ACJ8E3_07560 [Sphingomicrobium sp.]
MSEPPRIGVTFAPVPPEKALFARRRERGVPLAWQSAFIPPYEDFLNLDSFIVLDLVAGEVEGVEILYLEKDSAQPSPANDTGRTHKMIVDLSNREKVEREITISVQQDGADLMFGIERAPTPNRCVPLGGGLAALVAGDTLSGFRVVGYHG